MVSRIEGVRLEKTVRVPGPHGRDIDALVVSAPGGSAQFISVIEIGKSPPKLGALLDRALDKGGFSYLRDKAGRVLGLKFEYQAWHVRPEGLKGHVFTARKAVWDPELHRFRLGESYVDTQREKAASLLDVLTAICSAELLGMEESRDRDYRIYAYTYEPTGLLLEKTPPKLRSAKRVRVVVDRGASPDSKPRIASIEAAGM